MDCIRSAVAASVIAAGILAGTGSTYAMPVSFTVTNDLTSQVAGAVLFADFDSAALGVAPVGVNTSVGTFSGDWYLNGGVTPGGAGNWNSLGVQGGTTQSGELVFVNPVSYVGFRWGSTDRFNQLEVFDSSNTLLKTIFGIPDVTNPQVFNGVFLNLFGGDSLIKKLTFTSLRTNQGDSNPWAFEVDNFSATPVPLPATLPLLAGGVGLIALVGRYRARRQALAG
jgi:hypothetical protein